MRIIDCSSDVCSSDLDQTFDNEPGPPRRFPTARWVGRAQSDNAQLRDGRWRAGIIGKGKFAELVIEIAKGGQRLGQLVDGVRMLMASGRSGRTREAIHERPVSV